MALHPSLSSQQYNIALLTNWRLRSADGRVEWLDVRSTILGCDAETMPHGPHHQPLVRQKALIPLSPSADHCDRGFGLGREDLLTLSYPKLLPMRLDRWLVAQRPEQSRARIQKFIEAGYVRVNGIQVGPKPPSARAITSNS